MFKTVSQDVKNQRMSVCKTCAEYNSMVKTCKQCGCFMPAKATFAVSSCPLNKWESAAGGEDFINLVEEAILKTWNEK